MLLALLVAAAVVVLLLLVLLSALVLFINGRRIPPPYGFVAVQGIRLHYFERGAGPPVVILHGSNGSLQDFKLSIVDQLSKEFRVVAFDRPGHGHSERSPGKQRSCATHGALIMEAWKRLGISRPVLVGHSSAGAVLMDIVVRRPEEVSAIVMISGVAYSWGKEEVPVMGLYRLISHRFIGPLLMWTLFIPLGGLIGRWLLKFTFAPDPVPETYRRLGIALALRPKSLRAEAEDLACLPPTLKAVESQYARIGIPVMIVYGEKDQNVPPPGQSMRLHEELPSSYIIPLPETGHMPMFTRPTEVIEAIRRAWRLSQRQE